MGLQIGEIISKEQIEFEDLKGKTIAVDAFNALYQFLTTIRQADGTPLKDSKGNITSHLSGLLYRNMNLILGGVKLIYVFDGEAPKLKKKTHEKRKAMRDIMKEKYEKAKDEEDIEGMGKYARSETRLTDEMIAEAKELLRAMGVMIVQAPGEGEAQASELAKYENIYAVASQDYDCLMFKAPKLIQNLSMSRKRKTVTGYREVFPQVIKLDEVLKELEINQEQLICLGILCGTDYNVGGVKGLGPKKSLKLIKEVCGGEKGEEGSKGGEKGGGYCKKIFDVLENDEKYAKYEVNFDWKEIYDEIESPNVEKDIKLDFPKVNEDKIKEIMVEGHEFSEDRIQSQLNKLDKLEREKSQQTLF